MISILIITHLLLIIRKRIVNISYLIKMSIGIIFQEETFMIILMMEYSILLMIVFLNVIIGTGLIIRIMNC
jgi:hypothetical protein